MIKHLCISAVIIASILFFWRNIILNINTHLPGWYDELFIIWIYQNNIHHFTSFNFNNIYETNAIYPFKYTLSFAEHMYFPSFLILIISLFTQNIIAQYNILLVLNHVLIFLTGLLFFKKIIKNSYAAILSAFYLTFSPYFFIKMGHFQMIFFWPLLISLYFLARYFEKSKSKILILSGFFAGIQFLSSVYLGIMNLTIIAIWYVAEILHKKYFIKDLFKQAMVILGAFTITSSISLVGYFLVNQEYNIKRDYGEYVTYSANITDYIFPATSQTSFLYSNLSFQKIKSYNQHIIGEFAVFAGVLPLAFALFKLWPKIKKTQANLSINISITKIGTFSIILILVGFILSLGPKLFVNGQYTQIPLPYSLILKIFSPIGIIRAVARWHFLVILGFSLLLGLGYTKIEKRYLQKHKFKIIILSIIFTFAFIEFYPLTPVYSTYKNWQSDSSYVFLRNNICKNNNNTILLEYPFHYRNLKGDLAKDVNYMAQILLNSTQHNCKILSGYYGYEPPAYINIRNEFANGFSQKDINLIKKLDINYLKFNFYAISAKEKYLIEKEGLLNQFKIIYQDQNTTIFSLNN